MVLLALDLPNLSLSLGLVHLQHRVLVALDRHVLSQLSLDLVNELVGRDVPLLQLLDGALGRVQLLLRLEEQLHIRLLALGRARNVHDDFIDAVLNLHLLLARRFVLNDVKLLKLILHIFELLLHILQIDSLLRLLALKIFSDGLLVLALGGQLLLLVLELAQLRSTLLYFLLEIGFDLRFHMLGLLNILADNFILGLSLVRQKDGFTC
mmetsp:Transcript_20565/g.31329  ORF Transcript_20565/g.31329 Transcript_20565/m.31329 type:complete len:209 (+) Transcript_20565:1559-2185(+)